MRNQSKMFKYNLIVAALGTLASTSYAQSSRYMDYALVTDVTPIYRTYEHRIPQEECWVETVRVETPRKQHNSVTPTIVGGIVGGLVGNAVGAKPSSKKVGAVAGTILGMSVGSDIGRQQRANAGRTDVSYKDVERCDVTHIIEREEKLIGYDVSYDYNGQIYTTRMDHHPGKRVKVSVSVSPVDY